MVSECETQNNRLRSTLIAFSDLESSNSSPYLVEQFEEDMRMLSRRIDDRATLLTELHKELMATKADQLIPVENRVEKKQLLKENQGLINRALYLEKQMISSKLRLRLSHDHRDFCKLKRQLARLTAPGAPETPEDIEIQRNKERIKQLKHGIEHETNRLIRLAVPPTPEVEAAELIQRTWRGFAARQQFAISSTTPVVSAEEVGLVGGATTEQEFPELANSDNELAELSPQLPLPDESSEDVLV
jgi:hypothetical protein